MLGLRDVAVAADFFQDYQPLAPSRVFVALTSSGASPDSGIKTEMSFEETAL